MAGRSPMSLLQKVMVVTFQSPLKEDGQEIEEVHIDWRPDLIEPMPDSWRLIISTPLGLKNTVRTLLLQAAAGVGAILHESRFIKASFPLQDVGHFRFKEMKGGSQLTLVKPSGERDVIIDKVKRPQDALFLQQTLSRYLNIRPGQ